MENLMTQQQSDQPLVARLENLSEDGAVRLGEDEYLEIIRKLKLDLADKSNECELLKIRLSDSNQEVEVLNQELNGCKLAIFENTEDTRKTHEEVLKSKKLEEDYVKLMSDFLDLGERSNHYRQNLVDSYLAKTNAINNLECLITSGAYPAQLDRYKIELNDKIAELNLAQAKLRNLDEDNALKEKSIAELKKALEDAKITHLHEITVLEEYISCLKNTVTSYEKTLATYESKSQDCLEE